MYYRADNFEPLTIRVYKYITEAVISKEEAIKLKKYLIEKFKVSKDKNLTVITNIKLTKDTKKELVQLFTLTAINLGLEGNARKLEDFEAKDWSVIQTRFFIILNYLTGTLEYKDIINLDAKQRTDTGNVIVDKFNELSNNINTHTVLDTYIKKVSETNKHQEAVEIFNEKIITDSFKWSLNAKSSITSSLSENYIKKVDPSKSDSNIMYATLITKSPEIETMYYMYPAAISSTDELLNSKLIRYFNNLIYSSKTEFVIIDIKKITEMFASDTLSKASARNLKVNIKKAINVILDFKFTIRSNHSNAVIVKMTMFASTIEVENCKDFLKARINPDYRDFIKKKSGAIQTRLSNAVYSIQDKNTFNSVIAMYEHYTTKANCIEHKNKSATNNKFKLSNLIHKHTNIDTKSKDWRRAIKRYLDNLVSFNKITYKNIPDISKMSKEEVLNYVLILNKIDI